VKVSFVVVSQNSHQRKSIADGGGIENLQPWQPKPN